MNRSTPLFGGMDTLILRVSKLETSLEWYRACLGLISIYEDQALRLAVLDTGGPTSLTLWEWTKTVYVADEPAAYPIFRSTQAAQDRLYLQQKGVVVSELYHEEGIRYFRFRDPDGHLLEACEMITGTPDSPVSN